MINGEWIDVYKDPVTSSMKKSKRGRLVLVEHDGKFVTKNRGFGLEKDFLHIRFLDGKLYNQTTFNQIRINSKKIVR
jgi:nicotinamide phosphoribosyltransferase